MNPLFSSTKHVATPGALEALKAAMVPAKELLDRHFSGDSGDMDPGDQELNRDALTDGSRIFSSYKLPATGERVWVITDAEGDNGQREVTTILLPEEY